MITSQVFAPWTQVARSPSNEGPDGMYLMSSEDDREDSLEVVFADPQTDVSPPNQYKVLLINDDYTPMEFVIEVLQRYFGRNQEQATAIMLQVHTQGKGICGVYSRDIAETKVQQVSQFARQNQHPLLCDMEEH